MQMAAFFRGLNVGGSHKVKMTDLRQLFLDCGFTDIRSYIQSGNVLFAAEEEEQALAARIGQAFVARFGFASEVVVRSAESFAAILAGLPFTPKAIAQAEAANPKTAHVYVYMSNSRVDPAAVEALQLAYTGDDRLIAGEREIYLLCRQSVRDSKLAVSLAKLGLSLTARNLNTMHKIADMLRE